MRNVIRSRGTAVGAALMALVVSTSVFGQDTPPAPAPAAPAAGNDAVLTELKALRARVAELEQKENDNWLTKERTDQIRAIVEQTLADAEKRGHALDGDNFGYNNGFFIQTSDKNFRLAVDGYGQFRYTFAADKVKSPGLRTLSTSSQPKNGDIDGFDFRYARLYFSGNAFSPNLTYMIMGDFAGASSNSNDFQMTDTYVAYRFNDTFNIRAGAYLVPYSRLEYISSGLALVDFPEVLNPFDPKRSLGVSLYGEPIKDRLTYEVMVNNGPNANHNGFEGTVGGNTDNRLGAATRWQLFGGSGKPSDFADESDLRKDTSTMAWMLGAALGYDSLNSSSTAFPGAQNPNTIPVGTNGNPVFSTYKVNGNLFRATMDGEIKYDGWEFTGATFFEQINENNGPGVTSGSGANTVSKSSFYNASYYGQVGYMVAPKWEVVGRFGQFFSGGGSNTMNEFSLGLNYFMFGKNVKIQGDVTYIPNEAAVTDPTFGTVQNTQDIVARVQLQLKF